MSDLKAVVRKTFGKKKKSSKNLPVVKGDKNEVVDAPPPGVDTKPKHKKTRLSLYLKKRFGDMLMGIFATKYECGLGCFWCFRHNADDTIPFW